MGTEQIAAWVPFFISAKGMEWLALVWILRNAGISHGMRCHSAWDLVPRPNQTHQRVWILTGGAETIRQKKREWAVLVNGTVLLREQYQHLAPILSPPKALLPFLWDAKFFSCKKDVSFRRRLFLRVAQAKRKTQLCSGQQKIYPHMCSNFHTWSWGWYLGIGNSF